MSLSLPSKALLAAAVCALLAVFAPYLSEHIRLRDAKFYQPLPDLPHEFHRSGTVTVTHSEATLLDVADDQGASPPESVTLAYHTSYSADKTDDVCDAKKHILLLHGTGFNKDTFHWTKSSLKATGRHDGMASALPTPLRTTSIVSRLHAEPGVCVTSLDLRGHGDSSVTDGPWSVKLLAADVAAALKMIHGRDVKVHAYGHSVGFGTAMTLAMDYPELLWTVCGGGFLAGMTSVSSWPAYIFSRKIVVHALGMEFLAWAGASSILVSTAKEFIQETFHFIKLHGYLYTSQSWLNHNVADRLSTMKVPVLWQHPIKDDLCGYTVEQIEREYGQLPSSNGNKFIVYDEKGDEDHCYPYLDPDKYFGDVLDFVRTHS